MRRRTAFTLVEMMVAMALVLFIMVILTEAFSKGLESFRHLKAIGDMESRLRAAAITIRRDLTADHFEGKRRISDEPTTWRLQGGAAREGFVNLAARDLAGRMDGEGNDADMVPARRQTSARLHLAVKARGNERGDFFTARLPANSPLLAWRTDFFRLPTDARYQEGVTNTYNSQWAEVAYHLVRTGTTTNPTDTTTPLSAQVAGLFTLYRSQLVVLADNADVSFRPVGLGIPNSSLNDYAEFSCYPAANGNLHFNTPSDLADGRAAFERRNGAIIVRPTLLGATPLLFDVVSFDVQVSQGGEFVPAEATSVPVLQQYQLSNQLGTVKAVQVTLRIWDPKTKLTRQLTIVQDL